MSARPVKEASTLYLAFATIVVVYQLMIVGQFAAMMGYFIPQQVHRAISLSAAMILIFTMISGSGVAARGGVWWRTLVDWILLASALTSLGYIVMFREQALDYSMIGFLDNQGMVLAAMLCVPLIEAVRRTTGWTLPIIVSSMIAMTLFQNYLPGVLHGRGYDLDRLLYSAYIGEAGVFGLPLGVAANIILVFLVFGALMELGGAGNWFLQLALSLTGGSRGGPAKAAVIGSAFFGSISGSPSANVATTGAITIPLMKRVGYSPAFAGGVEAVASTGGQILPPVMGAIAFVMAEWIGVSYQQVVIAAAIPAILYFVVLFASVHLQACRFGLQPLEKHEIPDFYATMKAGWFQLIPLVALIYFLLVADYPPGMAGALSLPLVIGVSFLSKDRSTWLTPTRLFQACGIALRSWITIVAITAFVGIMIGALELSGVGIKISNFIVDLSDGDLILTMIMVGLACFVLGMGLDSIPVYVTLATLMGPALIKLGVDPMAAHLFVVYFGLSSFFTPPLCIAVFVAISISGAKLWETGWESVRLGIAVFVIPFAFVLNDGLLLKGSIDHIILNTASALIGAVLLACGMRGWALGPLNKPGCAAAILGGLLMIGPGYLTALAGLTLGAIAVVISMRLAKAQAA
jgi:TRAP transporter 4TM/12TM fusion protein